MGYMCLSLCLSLPKNWEQVEECHKWDGSIFLIMLLLVRFQQWEVGKAKCYGSLNHCYLSPCASLVFCIKIYVVKFMP